LSCPKWFRIIILLLICPPLSLGSEQESQAVRQVIIQANSPGPPISKYVYGQFIEHLGRCIYEGIWAEMLHDRKFFHDVGAEIPAMGKETSPWRILGKESQVTMCTENPYVGFHSPEIRSPDAGIKQEKLGLLAGKEYVGYLIAAKDSEPGYLEITLGWGKGPRECQRQIIENVTDSYHKIPFPSPLRVGMDSGEGWFSIRCLGRATFRIGAVSLMPADHVQGMRSDTLRLLKELDAPIYRWPGGNFVSGYNWKDGIGDRDLRPTRKNPAWKGIESNDFGLHEFVDFCRILNAEPLVVVNSGRGSADSAAEEVEYANGGAKTPLGKLRVSNGAAEPFQILWWGIGNEMYGRWQIGHMPLNRYVKKHNAFAKRMRKIDPRIKLIGVGALGRWSKQMLKSCSGHMDLISEHFYCKEKSDLAAHVIQMPAEIRKKAEGHRRYKQEIPGLAKRDIRIALDEWNYWYGEHLYGEIGTRYYLKDALGIAAGIHEIARNSDLFFMANYAQAVNVIGCIKTNKTHAAFATTGLVLKIYRHHFGTVPLKVSGESNPLDLMAAWNEEKTEITLAVVNPTMQSMSVAIEVVGTSISDQGRRWRISGNDEMAYNEPGREPKVRIVEEDVSVSDNALTIAPCSVSIYSFPSIK